MTISDILDGEPELVATGFKFTEGTGLAPRRLSLLQRYSGASHFQN